MRRLLCLSVTTVWLVTGCQHVNVLFWRKPVTLDAAVLCNLSEVSDSKKCIAGDTLATMLSNSGYIALSRVYSGPLGPGTLLQASDAKGVHYVGNLLDCVPSGTRPTPISTLVALNIAHNEFALSPKAFLRAEHIQSFGERFATVGRIVTTMKEAHLYTLPQRMLADSLDYIAHSGNSICVYNTSSAQFVVGTALGISGVEYRLFDSHGTHIHLTAKSLPEYIEPIPETPLSVDDDGNLRAESVRYIAVSEDETYSLLTPDKSNETLGVVLTRYCSVLGPC